MTVNFIAKSYQASSYKYILFSSLKFPKL